ncbi:DUF885 family protein [Croceicoccus ponticola]|uniref:DUF885 family protein n=1 Tax=Croceicoccus ponticola TaxID=2217664 RepID=A0A437GVD2_9SPHN|nr:DUF885 family protein [Croceicoccus ponticola]RVQ65754.1 DUF885 family protein [Croceicoccus ponticola]
MKRRQFLGHSATVAALAAGSTKIFAQAAAAPADRQLHALMDKVLWGDFRISPADMTSLGLDTGKNAWARSRLWGAGMADRVAAWRHGETMLSALNALDTAGLSENGSVQAEVLRFQLKARVSGREFGLGHVHSPYVLTQQDGMAGSVPDFLDSIHPIETADDAEAYLARLTAYAYALDDETALQKHEAARGYAAPSWSVTTAAKQRAGMIAGPAAENSLVRSLATRTAAKGIAGDWAARATRIVESDVYPALARQVAMLRKLAPGSRAGDGIWRVPHGQEIYARELAYFTTTDLSADEIHRIGLDQVAEIEGWLDPVLKEAGLSKGSAGERLQILNEQPGQVFDDSEAGRAELLKFLEGRVAKAWEQIKPAFDTVPSQPVEVRRVPVEIEQGASLGYYSSPATDGSRPGAFYINLYDVKDWPRYSLPALIYHETMPGHHLQTAISSENEELPMLLRNQYIGAYSEGWALYTEMVADELGMYEGVERAGALQSWLYRAARLVTDTGLHDKRWSREKGIAYFGSTVGYPANQTRSEVERYCAGPGQACSYKIGQNFWVEQRKKAQTALGDQFSLPRFHRIIKEGEMPLNLLGKRVDAWIAREKTRLGQG